MAAYIIAQIDVHNMEQYKAYTLLTPDAINKYGGKFIVRNGDKEMLEGEAVTKRMVVIEFPDMDTARAFYNSEEYTAAKAVREGAAEGSFLLIDGVD